MKVLITGATGFIGKSLTLRLAAKGHDILACGRSLDKLKGLSANVTPVYHELNDKNNFIKILKEKKPDIIYHAAALIFGSRKNLMRVNAGGTRNVLEGARGSGVKKIVHISSVAAVSGNTDVPLKEDTPLKARRAYGESKIEAEKIVLAYREKGLKIAVIRPPMVYGPHEPHALPFVVRLLRKRLFPVVGKGDKRIHMVSIDNLVDVLELALSKEAIYKGAYFAADKEALTLREILFYMAELLGAKRPFVIPFADFFFSSLRKERVYSIDRLREELGYVPRLPVREGLKKAVLSYV